MKDMVASKDFADASCRLLSIKALETYGYYISHVTFWQYMKQIGINGPRGVYAKRKQHHAKPDVGEITGPNQLWAWDITFLKTTTLYKKLYLYALLDCWSRKVIAWVVSDQLISSEAQFLWDQALIKEKLLNAKADDQPKSLSDRGSQMRSHSTKDFFKTLGIDQLFSRPRTPNDNPQIESLFSTVKNCPDYPERFNTLEEAKTYFDTFFNWYNHEHYHTALKMITPADFHQGKASAILEERKKLKQKTFRHRRRYHVGFYMERRV
mgnify:CR=1 FL=1